MPAFHQKLRHKCYVGTRCRMSLTETAASARQPAILMASCLCSLQPSVSSLTQLIDLAETLGRARGLPC
jgi:hypothetical protein